MSDGTFQWSSVAIWILALALIVLGAIGTLPGWTIAIGVIGGFGSWIALFHYWGKAYMSRHQYKYIP
jgi:hypothetical protein